MDEKLTLSNGTEITGHLLETSSVLFLYMYGTTLQAAFNLLIVPENVVRIDWERYGETGSVSGYNHLKSISEERNGMVCAGLIKAE